EMVFVWKQNYILVDEYFFFCCTWIVNSAKLHRIKIVFERIVNLSFKKTPIKGRFIVLLKTT
ncbi:hypothetical protein, partial [Escherichia coli]